MQKIVIITKKGSPKTENVKSLTLDTLYKKCKFRKADNFAKRATWKYDNLWVSVYARDTGRAGGENKYDMPPPIDKDLYFGSIAVIAHTEEMPSDNTLTDLTAETWKKVYEKCMGGFEDLGDEDTEEDVEEIPKHLQTKQGYSKEDGFVVSDGDEEEDEDYVPPDTDNDSEEEEEDDEDDADYGEDTDQEDEDEGEEEEEDDEDEDEEEQGEGSELSEEDYEY